MLHTKKMGNLDKGVGSIFFAKVPSILFRGNSEGTNLYYQNNIFPVFS